MTKFIPLSDLVEQHIIDRVEKSEASGALINKTKIRQHTITHYTPTRRLLWMLFGLEYIEPELLEWIDHIPAGSVFYDLGASNGSFSIYAALCGLQVVAIEPEAQNYALLERNHFLNREHIPIPMVTLNVAISDEVGVGYIHCAKYEVGGHLKILDKCNKVLERHTFPPEHSQSTLKMPLDFLSEMFKLPQPNFIKIDIDGAESAFMAGAGTLLSSPLLRGVFIELSYDQLDSFIEKMNLLGLKLRCKIQVQRYEGLFNCLFDKSV